MATSAHVPARSRSSPASPGHAPSSSRSRRARRSHRWCRSPGPAPRHLVDRLLQLGGRLGDLEAGLACPGPGSARLPDEDGVATLLQRSGPVLAKLWARRAISRPQRSASAAAGAPRVRRSVAITSVRYSPRRVSIGIGMMALACRAFGSNSRPASQADYALRRGNCRNRAHARHPTTAVPATVSSPIRSGGDGGRRRGVQQRRYPSATVAGNSGTALIARADQRRGRSTQFRHGAGDSIPSGMHARWTFRRPMRHTIRHESRPLSRRTARPHPRRHPEPPGSEERAQPRHARRHVPRLAQLDDDPELRVADPHRPRRRLLRRRRSEGDGRGRHRRRVHAADVRGARHPLAGAAPPQPPAEADHRRGRGLRGRRRAPRSCRAPTSASPPRTRSSASPRRGAASSRSAARACGCAGRSPTRSRPRSCSPAGT